MKLAPLSALLLVASSACTIVGGPPPVYSGSAAVVAGNSCGAVCGAAMGCRTGVDRLYHAGSGEHFYTTVHGEGTNLGFAVEGTNYFYLHSAPAPGLTALHRCLMSYGKHFYTTAPNCEGVTPGTAEGDLGYISTTPQCGAVPLFRSYNPGSNDHFYTIDAGEHARATHGGGWNDEGIVGYVWTSPVG